MAQYGLNFTQNSSLMKFNSKSSLLSFLSLFGLLSLTFLIIYIANRYILTVNFYDKSGDAVSEFPDQKDRIYENLQQWIYISSAIYILLKLFFITLILYTALYFFNYPVVFSAVFYVVVWSEFIFFVPALIKVVYFYFVYPDATLMEWHRFYVLSALSLFSSAPADWTYALQTLNVFEVLYWFLLAAGISRISKLSFDRSMQIVLAAYLPALVVWVSLVTLGMLVMFPATG
jgi:hypothetical protein